MPKPSDASLNDPWEVRQRAQAAKRRARGSSYGTNVQVGVRLLDELLDAQAQLARLHQAGWAVADDGDPYQPE